MEPSEVISISNLRANLASYLNRVNTGQIPIAFVGPHRKPIAALVNLELLRASGSVPSLDVIQKKGETLWRLASTYQISKIGIFGSVARGQANVSSDIDMAVSGENLTFLALTSFAQDVENLYGFEVQVATIESLSPETHSEALEDMVFIERSGSSAELPSRD